MVAERADHGQSTGMTATATREDSQPPIPLYVALITDGNGRWAHARGLPANEGHEAGADTLKGRLYDAVELGIQQLTVYFFSSTPPNASTAAQSREFRD
jgi:undecaprenyl pyrophosphate synthase